MNTDRPPSPAVVSRENTVLRPRSADIHHLALTPVSEQDAGWTQKMSAILTEAVFRNDRNAIAAIVEGYQRAVSARVASPQMLAFCSTALEFQRRFREAEQAAEFRSSSTPARFLAALFDGPKLGTVLAPSLGLSPSRFSQVGKSLQTSGLVSKRQQGGSYLWALTPKGETVRQNIAT